MPTREAWRRPAWASSWATLLAAAACGSARAEPCGLIPEGGCPTGRGGTCRDPLCATLWECAGGQWRFVDECAASGSAATTSASSSGAGGGCTGVTIDRTGETTGCTPDLQEPDCHVGVAESCQPCVSGCIDFFLCTADGWLARAYCSEDGELVLER
jgi:hypothetical protein